MRALHRNPRTTTGKGYGDEEVEKEALPNGGRSNQPPPPHRRAANRLEITDPPFEGWVNKISGALGRLRVLWGTPAEAPPRLKLSAGGQRAKIHKRFGGTTNRLAPEARKRGRPNEIPPSAERFPNTITSRGALRRVLATSWVARTLAYSHNYTTLPEQKQME